MVATLAVLLAAGSLSGGIPRPFLVFVIAAAWVGFQIVPLPPAMVRVISPEADALFWLSLGPLGLYPGLRPLSLNPPATGRELAKSVAFLLTASAAALLARDARRRQLLLGGVAISGLAVASVGLVAALVNVAPLLQPRVTFVNPNHLAGLLNLASLTTLGFAVRLRGRETGLWFVAFILSATGIFLSLSRGGIAAFFVGVAIFAFLYVGKVRTERDRSWFGYASPSWRSLSHCRSPPI